MCYTIGVNQNTNTVTGDDMTEYDRIIEALTIFSKYEHLQGISAEHDEIHAGPLPSIVNDEDLARLEELGWHDSGDDGFYKFV